MDKAILESDVREAWLQALMTAYGTPVLRVCYAYMKDAQLAEDAAQDTFIKAFRHYETFQPRGEGSEKAWLMRIAVNVCKDTLRGAWFRHVDCRVELDMALLQAQEDMSHDQRHLLEAVLDLPPRHRMVIVLHYYQNFSVEEVAQALGISPSTVYYRLDRARAKLRGLLEGGQNG